jgi:hypothetical protein
VRCAPRTRSARNLGKEELEKKRGPAAKTMVVVNQNEIARINNEVVPPPTACLSCRARGSRSRNLMTACPQNSFALNHKSKVDAIEIGSCKFVSSFK